MSYLTRKPSHPEHTYLTWLEILVIIPKHDMYDNLERTCVTPDLSILNLLIDQFPLKLKFVKLCKLSEQLILIYSAPSVYHPPPLSPFATGFQTQKW
jgi:hypothetical protein